MKNKKAFTLVELLAVIVILAVILMIVIPSVLKSYNNNKDKLYDVMKDNICRSANLYFEEYQTGLITNPNMCEVDGTTNYCDISLQELIDKKYLDKDLVNPKTERDISTSTVSIVARYNSASGQVDSNNNPIYTFILTIDSDEHICNQ